MPVADEEIDEFLCILGSVDSCTKGRGALAQLGGSLRIDYRVRDIVQLRVWPQTKTSLMRLVMGRLSTEGWSARNKEHPFLRAVLYRWFQAWYIRQACVQSPSTNLILSHGFLYYIVPKKHHGRIDFNAGESAFVINISEHSKENTNTSSMRSPHLHRGLSQHELSPWTCSTRSQNPPHPTRTVPLHSYQT